MTLLIILIIAIVLDVIGFFFEETDFSVAGLLGSFGRGALLGLGILVAIGIAKMIDEGREPKAIDLYKGDAEVKIIYTDSIPTDTIVVWKDGRKREW